MIGFSFSREKERTSSRSSETITRLSLARAAIFSLWVMLVFALISLLFSINNHDQIQTTHSTPRRVLNKKHSFSTTLFHPPSSSSAQNIAENTALYGDDKRIIHTGPNPLHN
uniref:CLAVATA3/ESR-related 42 n=1 Tax=Lotus japonicus TaxID=34305 RepID=A0A193PF82_LOTJA|nr:CLAVATA3/ESR-related 42 [Lotus japonicus]